MWVGVQQKHACSTMLTCFGITVRCSRLCIIRSAGGCSLIFTRRRSIKEWCQCLGTWCDTCIWQGRTNPRYQVVMVIKLCTVVHSVCRSLLWNLMHVSFLPSRSLRWLLYCWKICVLLVFGYFIWLSHVVLCQSTLGGSALNILYIFTSSILFIPVPCSPLFPAHNSW